MMRPGGDGDDASSSARKRRRRPEPSPTQRALSLLTRREHSKRELARKLLVRGVPASEASEAIARLADAPDEVARFRRQARQAAPQFSRDTQAERMLEAFAAAISRKSDG